MPRVQNLMGESVVIAQRKMVLGDLKDGFVSTVLFGSCSGVCVSDSGDNDV